ncbi:hypothetical protein M2451_001864 [Dysgonomonas sp. PFB1-18]|nr:hypothetical protein [Dysgonomonas sp. PF1-14]MDH6339173.1 hypothetical protein [Dysgonomonas sp. PF1-16]MDH6380540.1 hypothetical protein [Dysgonomonas sp. PFB1-18]MDH6398036.1 hypothetical protein [Dysgonomonas sp. PF1-23]
MLGLPQKKLTSKDSVPASGILEQDINLLCNS